MKKILSILILLACIVSSIFASPLSASISETPNGYYRTITVTDERNEQGLVLIYTGYRPDEYSKRVYSIEWYDDKATAKQIKEWIDFAKIFVEEY